VRNWLITNEGRFTFGSKPVDYGTIEEIDWQQLLIEKSPMHNMLVDNLIEN